MEIKVKALCVKSIDYRDNDSLITLATLGKGKITAIVKGSKKQTSKLRFSSSPFTFGEYILTISKSGRYTVTGCDLIDGFFKLREDIEKFYICSIMLEILEKNLIVASDKLILATLRSLEAVCYDENDMVSELIKYIYEAIVISGFALPKISCKVCDKVEELYFDKTDLDFVCKAHKINKGVLLKQKEIEGLTYVYNQEFDSLNKIDRSTRLNIMYILISYFELISEQKFKTYQSYFDLLTKIG